MDASVRVERSRAWIDAGRIGFKVLYAATLLAALGWAFSNIREIAPENQAVVFRFGQFDRVAQPGLLVAWPRPFEQIVLLPSPSRVLKQRVDTLPAANSADEDGATTQDDGGKATPSGGQSSSDTEAGSHFLLTGDGGAVQLSVTIFYTISDPYAYVLERQHIAAALERVVKRNAVLICAQRDIDGILVTRPETGSLSAQASADRARLRTDLVEAVNRSLADLRSKGGDLGINAVRADIQSTLPFAALDAFNAVVTAEQQARQEIAKAQNDEANTQQAATQDANRIVQVAQANADERAAEAKAHTATITQLTSADSTTIDPDLPLRLYRSRIARVLEKAGSVTTVPPTSTSSLILPGPGK